MTKEIGLRKILLFSPCKFLVVGNPIFGLWGLLPIWFVAFKTAIDDVYCCAEALNSKQYY